MDEARGVEGLTEVTVRLTVERRPTLSRVQRNPQRIDVDDRFSREVGIDEAIADAVQARWTALVPGAAEPGEPFEPDGEIVEALESPRRQAIVRPFKRPEQELDPVSWHLEKKPGLSRPLEALEKIAWFEREPPFRDWSLGQLAEYRESRRAWVWCDASLQRRRKNWSEKQIEENFTGRLRERDKRLKEAELAERFQGFGRRPAPSPAPPEGKP